MDNKRRSRYVLAIYLVVASLAVIFALIGLNYLSDQFQALAINLASEFLGVVLLFFVVDRLFVAEEWKLSERMEQIASRLEERTNLFHQETKSLRDMMTGSTDVSILGYSLVSVLRSDFASFIECVKAGTRLRLLIVDPNSNAAQVILDHSQVKDFSADIFFSLQHAKRIYDQISPKGKGKVEVRMTTWLPSYGLTLINKRSEKGTVKVVIYPPYSSSSFGNRVQFILKRNDDPKWFDVFAAQFESMWSAAQEVDLSKISYDAPKL